MKEGIHLIQYYAEYLPKGYFLSSLKIAFRQRE